MKYRITRSEDLETVREAHKLAFPGSSWPGDDHEYWLVHDELGRVVGFASAFYWGDLKCVFLSRAAIITAASGTGLQRRLIQIRIRWARSISGAAFCWTYVERWNYASLYNLMKCGFKANKKHRWGTAWHTLTLRLGTRKRAPTAAILKRID